MATYTSEVDALVAYHANTDYDDGVGDITKAQAFRSAIRFLLSAPQFKSQSGTSTSKDLNSMRAELVRVSDFITAKDACVSRTTFSNARDIRK